MKRILVIAPAYCKPYSPNGQIERHFFPRLPREDYCVSILCVDRWNYANEADNCVLIKTRVNKCIDYACRFLFHTPFPYIGNVPDNELYSWGKHAINEAIRMSQKTPFDLIHSISMPCSAHIVAYEIKRKLSIPWIAQFYDPWSGNPFRVMKSKQMLEEDRKYEKQVALNADLIVHPCQAMIDYWNNLFGNIVKGKLRVLPFVTEIPSYNDYQHTESRLVISHIGNFSRNRNASVFIKALSILNDAIRSKIVVNFVGSVEDEDVRLIKEYRLQDTVRLIGRVSENECHKYYVESDLFLIIDIDCTPNLFYPSKILKYFCYKKPILGITTEHSVIRNELELTGNHAFKYDDVEGVAKFLEIAVNDYNSLQTNDKEYYKKFSTDSVVSEYCNLVDSLFE